jgi:hypothetical protein
VTPAAERPVCPDWQKGELRLHDTHFAFWFDQPTMKLTRDLLHLVLDHLRGRCFEVQLDPRVLRDHPTIAEWHWIAQRGDLRAAIEAGGRQGSVEFYQELVTDNRLGGRYDFNKGKMMPEPIRRKCAMEIARLVELMMPCGFALGAQLSDHRGQMALRALRVMLGTPPPDLTPLDHFNRKWGVDRFKRGADGYPLPEDYGHDRHRDPALRAGDTRYMRHEGRLVRGIAVCTMNTRWQLHLPDGTILYCESSDLLNPDRPDLEPRRLFPKREALLTAKLKDATDRQDWRSVSRLAHALDLTGGANG